MARKGWSDLRLPRDGHFSHGGETKSVAQRLATRHRRAWPRAHCDLDRSAGLAIHYGICLRHGLAVGLGCSRSSPPYWVSGHLVGARTRVPVPLSASAAAPERRPKRE